MGQLRLLIQKNSHLEYSQLVVGHEFQTLQLLLLLLDSHGQLPVTLGYVLGFITKKRNTKNRKESIKKGNMIKSLLSFSLWVCCVMFNAIVCA